MERMTRREVLAAGGIGVAVIGLPLAEPVAAGREVEANSARGKLKVMVVGAHPDDPEQSCGGTIARYADAGHDVVVCYLTRGEAGIRGKSHDEAAAIRTAEAKKACELLGARPLFAGQIDGSTEVTAERYEQFRRIVEQEKPDVLFTHWPIDTHRDHRVASLMSYDAWLRTGRQIVELPPEATSSSGPGWRQAIENKMRSKG